MCKTKYRIKNNIIHSAMQEMGVHILQVVVEYDYDPSQANLKMDHNFAMVMT